jgi:hypothetical protein
MHFLIQLRNGDVFRLNTESEKADQELALLLDRLYYLIPLALYSRVEWEGILKRETWFRLDNPASIRDLLLQLQPDLVHQFVYGESSDIGFAPEKEDAK